MRGRGFRLRPTGGLDLIDKVRRTAELIRDEEDVANVDGDRTIDLRVVIEIVTEAFEIAVENKADLFAVCIENGRTTVAANDIGRASEVERNAVALAITAKVMPMKPRTKTGVPLVRIASWNNPMKTAK